MGGVSVRPKWKVLLVHPSALMYSEVYLRLEPLGLELVAQSCRQAGYAVRLLDLQVFSQRDYFRMLTDWRPDAVGFSLNYLANIPEVIDLAKETREEVPGCLIFVGGHSASFTANEILRHANGAIDCVVRGEGEEVTPRLLALEYARSLDISVAVNIIADPDWDAQRFEVVREWALSVPEIVHLTVNTPYPGTETWLTESRRFTTRDYRLFDVQHAVLPTRMPLEQFYQELVKTQDVLNRKHLGWAALRDTCLISCRYLAQGRTDFVRMLWKFNQVYNHQRQFSDHQREARYDIHLPDAATHALIDSASLYVHPHVASPLADAIVVRNTPRPSP